MNDFVSSSGSPSYRVGDWEAYPKTCRIVRDDTEVKLSPRSMSVLVYLAERAGDAVTHEELLAEFWRGAVSSPNAVHKCVAELRHAFGNGGGESYYIQTVPKRGYRLVVPVQHQQNPVGAAVMNGAPPEAGTTPSVPPASIARRAVPRRALALAGAIVLTACVVIWWAWSGERVNLYVISHGARTAALLPIAQGVHGPDEIRILEEVNARLIARVESSRVVAVPAFARPSNDSKRSGRAVKLGVDYVVEIDVKVEDTRVVATLAITPAQANGISHQEYFEQKDSDRAGLIDDLVAHAGDELAVVMDEEAVRRMREWNTRSLHAYLSAREGDVLQRTLTVESLTEAEQHFRASIDADSGFVYGYESLSAVYHDLAMMAKDTPTRERVRQSMKDLLQQASLRLPNSETLAAIERQYRFASLANTFEAELFWRKEIIKDPGSVEALRRYADLLVGAGLIPESERYLERAISLASKEVVEWLELDYATLAGARGDHEEEIRLMRINVERFPDSTISTFGLVRALAKLGKFPEAEIFLHRLEATDAVWGYFGRLTFMAFRGDLRAESDLSEALAHPLATNTGRGIICFMLGDVECGVRYWREIEPVFLPILWQFNPGSEWFFAPGVVADERYQALLDELGFGRRWRAYMRIQTAAMTPITGVEVTTPPEV